MQGVIVNFRKSMHRQYNNHMIIQVENIKNRDEARKLIKKKVRWLAPGKNKKELIGEIKSPHGNKGAVRAIFKTGMPGQSVGTKVEII